MYIFGLIIETLDPLDGVFKGAHAVAYHRALGEQCHTVLKEHRTLDGVLVGPEALEAVCNKAGEERIAQGDGFPAVQAGLGDLGPRFGTEIKVNHLAVFGYCKLGTIGLPFVQHRFRVHHHLGHVLGDNGDLYRRGGLHRQGVFPGGGVGTPAQSICPKGKGRGNRQRGSGIGHHEHTDSGEEADSGPLVRLQNGRKAAKDKPLQQADYRHIANHGQQRHHNQHSLAVEAGEGHKGKHQGGHRSEDHMDQRGSAALSGRNQIDHNGQQEHGGAAHTKDQKQPKGIEG